MKLVISEQGQLCLVDESGPIPLYFAVRCLRGVPGYRTIIFTCF